MNRSLLRLALCLAYHRQLDAVIDSIAEDMQERIGHLIDHSLVELGILAIDDQLNLLASLVSDCSNSPLEPRTQGRERDHAQSHQLILDIAAQPSLTVETVFEIISH